MAGIFAEMECAVMAAIVRDQGTITKYTQETHLLTWLEAFLIDRKD